MIDRQSSGNHGPNQLRGSWRRQKQLAHHCDAAAGFGIRMWGAFVSHEKEHVRKSLNTLSVLNAKLDSLCAGRWLISRLFVTTNS